MPRHAEKTSVSTEKSRWEIEQTLARYGATSFAYATEPGRAVIGFKMSDRHVRFVLPMPDRNDSEFQYTPARKYLRDQDQQYKAWEQACRQRWRALLLVIKAKLEAVEAGITEFEDEFLSHIVLPGGQTVSQVIRPNLAEAYRTGLMPQRLLPMLDVAPEHDERSTT